MRTCILSWSSRSAGVAIALSLVGCSDPATVPGFTGAAGTLGGDGSASTGGGADDGSDDNQITNGWVSSGVVDGSSGSPETSGSGDTTGSASSCGNDVAEGDEACDGSDLAGGSCTDLGYDGGRLACASDCTFDETACVDQSCGDDEVQGREACDGTDLGGADCGSIGMGFDGGALACDGRCNLDVSGCTTCGDDTAAGAEVCDGADLGGETCVSQGFDGGEVSCAADCSALDTSACHECGDGAISGPESCDAADLAGETCESQGYGAGALGCGNDCQFDYGGCSVPGTPFGSDSGYNGYETTGACDDISASGTAMGLTDDDNAVVPLGFTFPVYGVDVMDANIQSNGTLRFGDALYLTYTNTCLPTATAPSTDTLYVFWDDLNPTLGAGEVYYETLGAPGNQRFVVQWDVANFGGDTVDLMRFQVMLHEQSGRIDVCYPDTVNAANTANSGAEASAGIQQDSADALQFSCNTPDLVDGLRLVYLPT